MKVFFILVIIFLIIGFLKFKLMVLLNNEEGIKITLKIMIIKLFEYPSKKKQRDLKEKDLDSDKISDKSHKHKKKKDEKKKKKKKKNILQMFSALQIFILPLPKFLKFLNKGLKVTDLKILMKVGGEDAKTTALNYSKKVSLIFNILSILQRYCSIEKKDISISPNFLAEESKYKMFVNIKISVGRVVIGVLMYAYLVFMGLLSKKI